MGEEAEAASLMGFWDTLAKKLPTMRGVISYFYVAANWSRISEEQEALRRQIKDREKWADRMLAQQGRLHDLAREEMQRRVDRMESLAERAIDVAEHGHAIAETVQGQLDQTRRLFRELTDDAINGFVVLAQALLREDEATRNTLLDQLGAKPRTFVESVMRQLTDHPAQIAPGPPPSGLLQRPPSS